MGARFSKDDAEQAVAYIAGRLGPLERAVFESRLLDEPELAEVVQKLSSTEAWMRTEERRTALIASGHGRRKHLVWGLALVAGVLVLAMLTPHLARRGPASFEVTLAAGFASWPEFALQTRELAGLVAPGLEASPGAAPARSVEAAEFVALANALDDARPTFHDATNVPPIEAHSFVIPFECVADAYLIVLGLPLEGERVLRLFPGPASDPSSALAATHKPAGRHLLPRPRFELERDDLGAQVVRHRAGFVVPEGAGELLVLVAVRSRPIDPRIFAALTSSRAENPQVADLRAQRDELAQTRERVLRAEGFEVAQLLVREPQP